MSEMDKQLLNKKAIIVWHTRATILLIIMAFLCGGVGVFSIKAAGVLLATGLCVYGYGVIFYHKQRYEAERYKITPIQVQIERGVYFSRAISIYIKRIQYIELTQDPIQRFLGLCTVIFHAAGIKVSLAQLEFAQGQAIRDKLRCDTT